VEYVVYHAIPLLFYTVRLTLCNARWEYTNPTSRDKRQITCYSSQEFPTNEMIIQFDSDPNVFDIDAVKLQSYSNGKNRGNQIRLMMLYEFPFLFPYKLPSNQWRINYGSCSCVRVAVMLFLKNPSVKLT